MGIAIRLVYISQPFLDSWCYRQTTVAMMARNFYRYGFDIFYPQVDWVGPLAGYIGSEFPLVPFLAALLYACFGEHEWVGRSLSVVFFALSVPCFYSLVKRVYDGMTALCAVTIYVILPLSVIAGRSFMSDMASLSLSIGGLDLFARWLDKPTDLTMLMATVVCSALAILLKLPAIIISVPLAYMAWTQYGWQFLRTWRLYGIALPCLIVPLAWYAHAYLVSIYYPPHHFTGERGIQMYGPAVYAAIIRRFAVEGVTIPVFVAMVGGALLPAESKIGRLFHWWLLAVALFVFLAAEGNRRHLWYQLPVVPVAAAFSGRLCYGAWQRLSKMPAALLAFTFFAATAYLSCQHLKLLYAEWAAPMVTPVLYLNRSAAPGLIAVADDGNSTTLYYGNRKGWHFLKYYGAYPADSSAAIESLEQLRADGASFLIFTAYSEWWLQYYPEFCQYLATHYARIGDTSDYAIFDLRPNGAALEVGQPITATH
jgi:4-amino-4-deoxy-L-arabinose transferase-like glycosyltransferase